MLWAYLSAASIRSFEKGHDRRGKLFWWLYWLTGGR